MGQMKHAPRPEDRGPSAQEVADRNADREARSPRYEVSYTIRRIETKQITVALNTKRDDLSVRAAVYQAVASTVPEGYELWIDNIRALNGPWVSGGWYDLHGPGDVMCFEPALGNKFQEGDRELLERRINDCGYEVVDRWNGTPGTDTVSFKCAKREGTERLPTHHLHHITAPRPERP